MTSNVEQPEYLPIVNRDCVVLLPTEAFRSWAMSCPEGDTGQSLSELREDASAYLIEEVDYQPHDYLRQNYRTMLERELHSWCMDRQHWPSDLSYQTFAKLFDVQYCSLIFDMEPEPLHSE